MLLDGGTPLVPGLNRPINLELVSAAPIQDGCVCDVPRDEIVAGERFPSPATNRPRRPLCENSVGAARAAKCA